MGICGSTNQSAASPRAPQSPPALNPPMPTVIRPGPSGFMYVDRPKKDKKDLTPYEQVCPDDPDHGLVEQDVLPLLRIDNDNNLNKRYTYLYKVDPNKKVGKDIKATYGYDSRVSLEELKKKRNEFWDTRIEGVTSTWQALRYACEADSMDISIPVLLAAGVKLLNKTLQMSYDDKNFRYDLPIFVINDPTGYISQKDEDGFEEKTIKIKMRMGARDIAVEAKTSDLCSTLVNSVHEKTTDKAQLQGKVVKLFYSGRELIQDKSIGQYFKEDAIVVVFLRPAPA